jgi:hypothetical protein
MPLPVPRLDDRTFDQLVAEGRSLIPRYTRRWTNHNVSDPGITLLELFAYLTETAIFQLDQVPEQSIELFLRLVGVGRLPGEPITAATARALAIHEQPPRAVTPPEIVRTAIALSAAWNAPVTRGALVLLEDDECPPGDVPFGDVAQTAVLVVVTDGSNPDRAATRQRLFPRLKEYVPLATRLEVLEAIYVRIRISARVVRRTGTGIGELDLRTAVATFLHPMTGGEDGTGWPFGRPVYRSELFQLLEGLAAVDHVERLELAAITATAVVVEEGVLIPPLALIDPDIDFQLTVVDG